jgi:prevent-host-death family protein
METTTRGEFELDVDGYLARAEAGESFVVTSDGRSVAVLVPASPSPGLADEMLRLGELIPPERPFGEVFRSEPLPGKPGFSASAELDRLRSEERY